jgi:hypothetical protein
MRLGVGVLALLPLLAVAGDAPAKKPLDALKALAGKWERQGTPGVAVEFRVIAAGSTVIETMLPGTPEEMVNLYTMDGDRLLMTHYCAMGNQPRLKLVSSDNGKFKFEFVDASNLASRDDEHMDALLLTIQGPDQITEEWNSFKEGKSGEHAEFKLTRKKS